MFRTCLFCHSRFRDNAVLRHCKLGELLAFDPVRGRLWLVCQRCTSWNLAPFTERLDAIEELEHLASGAKRRVATDNIAMIWLEGLRVIRVGRSTRAEFAAWRYGPRFRRRRAWSLVKGVGAAGAGVGVGVMAAGLVPALTIPTLPLIPAGIAIGYGAWFMVEWIKYLPEAYGDRFVARLPVSPDSAVGVTHREVRHCRIERSGDGRPTLTVGRFRFADDTASQGLSMLMPIINRWGADRRSTKAAIRLLERQPKAGQLLHDLTASGPTQLRGLPRGYGLAIEMTANEDLERAAIEGELALLEAAWREAEAIAAITDSLLVPQWVTRRIDEWRRKPPRVSA